MSDPGKPYGNVTTWPTLRAARADLARVAAAYRFHPTGNGLERIADGFRPSHLSQALLLTT